MSQPLDARLTEVFRRALRMADLELDDDLARGEFEQWDSLGHLMLVQQLCDEFSVDITPEQAIALESVADIKRLLAELSSKAAGSS